MNNIEKILNKLNFNNQLTSDDIPNIDLYVDQVIQLFEKQYTDSLRNEDEKVLTKTMINNYAKGRLFFPIKNKKYSKDHLMLINLIYQLKGALSINDIKKTLYGINKSIINGKFNLEQFYEQYLTIVNENVNIFKDDVSKITDKVIEVTEVENDGQLDEMQTVMLITSLINMSNFYRRFAEKLVDDLNNNENEEKRK